ncbi:MAG: tail fiber protein [Verrucomicrobia bacterium]|nr:tail fiber protein [Verrucomicrobiota bacterium]MBI3870190.1 tail fiber protein [Verrucomicrobiota bacterium]
MSKLIPLSVGLLAINFWLSTLQAQQAPRLLPFQGRLTDQNGSAVSNGVRLVQFKIFDVPSAGSPVWAGELHRTTVNGGLVNVILGTKTALAFDFDRQLYLEITVDINADGAITAADPPMSPRQAILPVIFAKESGDSRLLAGYNWSAILVSGNDPANGFIRGNKLADESLSGQKIINRTITPDKIADHSIGTPQLDDAVVDARVLADNSVTTSKIAPGAIDSSKLAQDIVDRIIPAGTIIAFGGTQGAIPSGWTLCDGADLDRAGNPRLWAAIGTNFGSGDGSTTFNVPDLRGVFLRGVDSSSTRGATGRDPDSSARVASKAGSNTGNAVGSLQNDEIKSHTHTTSRRYVNAVVDGAGPWSGGGQPGGTGIFDGINPTGGSESRPKNVYVNYIIKN